MGPRAPAATGRALRRDAPPARRNARTDRRARARSLLGGSIGRSARWPQMTITRPELTFTKFLSWVTLMLAGQAPSPPFEEALANGHVVARPERSSGHPTSQDRFRLRPREGPEGLLRR